MSTANTKKAMPTTTATATTTPKPKPPAPGPNELCFAVDVELIVKSKTKTHADFASLASEIRTHLTAAGVSSWTITKDHTLTSEPQPNVFGLKLGSPIFVFKKQSEWNTEIRKVWIALQINFDVQATDECSTRVQISFAAGPWALHQLQNIAKATVVLERCIDGMMPAHRRNSPYCMSNRYNQGYKNASVSSIWSDIDKVTNERTLAQHMCWCDKDLLQGRLTGANKDFMHPHFRWNFLNVLNSKKSVEFRQPPASRDANDTILWVLFATSLIRWALVGATTLVTEAPAILKTLEWCVNNGADKNMVRDKGLLMGAFRGVRCLFEGPFDLRAVSGAEYRKLQAEAGKKGISFERYKKLAANK